MLMHRQHCWGCLQILQVPSRTQKQREVSQLMWRRHYCFDTKPGKDSTVKGMIDECLTLNISYSVKPNLYSIRGIMHDNQTDSIFRKQFSESVLSVMWLKKIKQQQQNPYDPFSWHKKSILKIQNSLIKSI